LLRADENCEVEVFEAETRAQIWNEGQGAPALEN
jgi:hypothetical protein